MGHGGRPPAAVREAAAARSPDLKAVLLTHNETSTGVTNDIAALAAAVREAAPDALLLVDAISALGAVPFAMDDWGLDVVVTGSQKAWMAAPGHGDGRRSGRAPGPRPRPPRCPASTSTSSATARRPPRARRRGRRPSPCSTRWTRALRLMQAEGDGVFARHEACAAMTRAGLRALGFELLADDAVASKTVTAAWIPDGLDWKAFNGALKRRGLVLAGGQGKLKGRIFRLGHLGSVTTDDILAALGDARGRAAIELRPRRPRRARRVAARPAGAASPATRRRPGSPDADPRRRAARRARASSSCARHHEVDEQLGLPREELVAILPEYDALVVRSQVKVDAEVIAAGDAADRHRPGRRRRRQRRPRGGDPGRDHRRQRADRQHDRGRRAHARAAVRARPPDRGGRRLDAPRRVEARRSSRASSCAARRSGIVGLGKIGQAIADRAAGAPDDGPRLRPVRDPGAGREPRRGAGAVRRDRRPRRRDHGPRAQDQGDDAG